MINAKVTYFNILRKILKGGTMLHDLPGPCLLMGLSSLEGSDGQSLCYIVVHLTLLNRPFSKGY